jgi:hypothetical protein
MGSDYSHGRAKRKPFPSKAVGVPRGMRSPRTSDVPFLVILPLLMVDLEGPSE